jgi:hypothetical protein
MGLCMFVELFMNTDFFEEIVECCRQDTKFFLEAVWSFMLKNMKIVREFG